TAAPVIHAHPALWHVRGPKGEAYLFGSIHLLPRNIDWHTKAVDAAIKRADVFVFEVATDDADAQAEIHDLIAEKGMLPPGRSLRAMLPPASQKDFDAAIAKAHLSPATVNHEKPWLVSLQLLIAQSAAKHYSASAGVDQAVMAIAARRGKPSRYFETIDQQVSLLAGSSDKLQLSEFESDLKDFGKSDDDLKPVVDAWKNGQEDKLAEVMNSDLADDPEMKKALLTDRNRDWIGQIGKMLTEKKVFFITVGAGHLAGPDGVPALLRAAGYKVDGP
ncbi:MAG TPA: TraB/GumN family protein, partial [Rhizomicrobium sp.]|nr:TraB/GumN family protein [Rhizomicrobium sp.]